MGFTTWPYASTIESVDDTYAYISQNADIYSEHIDGVVPWSAWINGLPLPASFTNDIAARAGRRIPGIELSLSVSLLNTGRSDLANDVDGASPSYAAMNDLAIEDAYVAHLEYIVNQLNPDYLLMSIESNELLKNAPEKWSAYKLLAANVKARVQAIFPELPIAESLTLHNYFQPDVPDPEWYIDELTDYANAMDFVGISFYPFFSGLQTKEAFQSAFDFLHEQIQVPIVFSETGHLSEDLTVDAFNLFISGDQCGQNAYLETLLSNAQSHNYGYVVWWTHRDYDALWEVFPEDVQDLGRLWISTGLINEDGAPKRAASTWAVAFQK
jgi:hypothetical protein